MAHGKSLSLRAIQRPEPTFIHEHAHSGIFSGPSNVPYVNPERDNKPNARLRSDVVVTLAPAKPARSGLIGGSGSAKRRQRAIARRANVARIEAERTDGAA